MGKFLSVAGSGFDVFRVHPLRSLVTCFAVVAVLLPFLVCLALSAGIKDQARAAVHYGADLYVTAHQFGRPAPVPMKIAPAIARIDGVVEVVPRIVGQVALGREAERAVVVGIPQAKLPAMTTPVRGRVYADGKTNELVIGSELAQRLRLDVDSVIPPFYRNRRGERVSVVVGIFDSTVSIWQSRLVFTSFETASIVFDQEDLATDLMVHIRPGYHDEIRRAILQAISNSVEFGGVRLSVAAKDDLLAMLTGHLGHREGIFNLHFVLAFAVGIAVTTVTSGVGLSERRREVGILKAVGWQTDEILLRSLVESSVLSLLAALVSLVLAYVWLRWLNGFWIAGIFLAGAGVVPQFMVPYRLAPIPVLLAFLISFVVIMSGTVYSTWRAASVPPVEAMR
jgi:ABC-type lipoprotein release transport system permease subunit